MKRIYYIKFQKKSLRGNKVFLCMLMLTFSINLPSIYAQADKVIDNILLCSSADIQLWNKIMYSQLGVAGNDYYLLDTLGMAPAKIGGYISEFFTEWYPVNGTKQTLVGTLTNFYQTDDWFHKDIINDEDYNLHIEPDVQFRQLDLDLNPGDDIGCEICIDKPLGIFSHGGYLAQQVNRKAGLYGMWVWDVGWSSPKHVEIHPAEQIWFRTPVYDDSVSYFLILTADASDRFDGGNDYNKYYPDSAGTGKWLPYSYTKPWAQVPMNGVFAVPFEIKGGETTQFYRLGTVAAENADAQSDGLEHRLISNGKRLIVLKERPGKYEDYALVDFEKVCKSDDGTIRGYIIIKSRINKISDDVEGGTAQFQLRRVKDFSKTPFTLAVQSIKRLPLENLSGTPEDVSLEIVSSNGVSSQGPLMTIPYGGTKDFRLSINTLRLKDYYKNEYAHECKIRFIMKNKYNRVIAEDTLKYVDFGINKKIVLTHTIEIEREDLTYEPEDKILQLFEVTYNIIKPLPTDIIKTWE